MWSASILAVSDPCTCNLARLHAAALGLSLGILRWIALELACVIVHSTLPGNLPGAEHRVVGRVL